MKDYLFTGIRYYEEGEIKSCTYEDGDRPYLINLRLVKTDFGWHKMNPAYQEKKAAVLVNLYLNPLSKIPGERETWKAYLAFKQTALQYLQDPKN